jgi:hypothetical protein
VYSWVNGQSNESAFEGATAAETVTKEIQTQ